MNDPLKKPTLYLSKVLDEERKKLKSFDRLAKEISEVNKGERGVDRRKLKKIVDEEEVSLTLNELRALDVYLTPLGEGLGDRPLFEKKRILEAFADRGDVVFLLGAVPEKPKEEVRTILSHWDVESMAEILRGLYSYRLDIRFDIRDILLPESKRDKKINNNNEMQKLLTDDGPSICSIGSPRSCYATEIMLSAMFGIEPNVQTKKRLPFYFYWPSKLNRKYFSSAFTISDEKLKEYDLEESVGNNGIAIAIPDDPKVFVAKKTGNDEWQEYGIVVVQRRKGGQTWLVIAGLTGPTTYATAKAIRYVIEAAAPARKQNAHSEILWGIVRTDIKMDQYLSGDRRNIVGDPKLCYGPKYYP